MLHHIAILYSVHIQFKGFMKYKDKQIWVRDSDRKKVKIQREREMEIQRKRDTERERDRESCRSAVLKTSF